MQARLEKAVRSRWSGLALTFALGLLAATGQAPLGWAWVSLAAFAAAIALVSEVERWQIAARRGWSFGTGYFTGALFWIVEPFLVDIARHGWMAPFALFFMAGGLALFWAAAFGFAARLGYVRRARVVWLVVLLTGAEILRSQIFTGFPWALIGHIWIGSPKMQLAALAGAHGLTLMTLLAAALPALAGARKVGAGILAGAAIAALPGGYGLVRVPHGAAELAEPAVTLRLIQPNAEQRLKWNPEMMPVFYGRQLDLTAAPSEGGTRPDIVIWPETAIPWLLDQAGPAFHEISAAAQGAQVVIGVQRRGLDGRWFNSLALLDPDGDVQAVYDKHHLVPFGEYMPFMDVFARLGVFGLAANSTGGYSPGPGPALVDFGAAGKALPLICYEAIFPNDIARAPGRPDWLLQITNDAWFGQLAGPYQHLALARLRAVEQGLPMFRAANTGVSAAFDPYGRRMAQIPLGTAGKADVRLTAALPPTFYSRVGDIPILALLAVFALAAGILSRRQHPA